ncbi:ATPase, F1/V1/A1 complex, alpha/beta subunit [Tanacetum coccineum]
MEHGFLSQKWSGGRRGVKEKNKDVATKDGVSLSVTIRTVVMEKPSSLVNTSVPTAENMEFSMDGLDAMLENGSWFIRNNPLILRKWHFDENLVKEDVSTIPVWVKLYDVPVTAFSEDGLSAIATKLADVELKDNIVAPMPKITREGYYTCNICVEYELKPPRCACCKVFGHVLEECPKNIGASATKNLKKTSQTPKGILVGPKMGFKPKQVFQPVSKKSTANSGVKKKNNSESTKVVSKSNPFKVLTSVDNDMDLGKLMFVDDDGNPIIPTNTMDSDSEVEVVFDETTNIRLSTSGKDGSDKGYGTNSLLEQWKDSYPDNDDYDPYDDDMYESHDMSEHLQSICDDLDITISSFNKPRWSLAKFNKVVATSPHTTLLSPTLTPLPISLPPPPSPPTPIPLEMDVLQEVSLSGSGVEPGEEVRSKRRFTKMSQPSHWIALDDVRQLSSKLKAKLMGKANVNVEIIILDDDDIEVVGDTMDTVMAQTDDESDSAMEGCNLEVTMENQLLKATPSGNVKACGNVGSQQLIPTRKSQRIQNQKRHALE